VRRLRNFTAVGESSKARNAAYEHGKELDDVGKRRLDDSTLLEDFRAFPNASDSDVADLPIATNDIAICVVGGARTFNETFPSILRNLIGGLTGDSKFGNAPETTERRRPNIFVFAFLVVADQTYAAQILSIYADHFAPYFGGDIRVDTSSGKPSLRGFNNLKAKFDPTFRSVITNQMNYLRVYSMVKEAELSRGRRFGWIVRTRPDFEWVLPHPPLWLLQSWAERDRTSLGLRTAFVPDSEHWRGANDRHMVIPRSFAAYFLGMLKLATDSDLASRILNDVPIKGYEGIRLNAEMYNLKLFTAADVVVRVFPPVAYLKFGLQDGLGSGHTAAAAAHGERYHTEWDSMIEGRKVLEKVGGWEGLLAEEDEG
jgi:hypothetical protein